MRYTEKGEKRILKLEDFGGKYKKSVINYYFVQKYFNSIKQLIGQIKFSSNFQTLEVGCGQGYSTRKLRNILPKNIKLEASEYIERQVFTARKRNPKIKIIQEDVYSLKRKDNSFDLILVLEVLEHLKKPIKALEELHRVSKKYLIVGVPREPI